MLVQKAMPWMSLPLTLGNQEGVGKHAAGPEFGEGQEGRDGPLGRQEVVQTPNANNTRSPAYRTRMLVRG